MHIYLSGTVRAPATNGYSSLNIGFVTPEDGNFVASDWRPRRCTYLRGL
jgi:hypothetical protein